MTECRRVQAYFDAFIDGELSPDRMVEVEQHVAACKRCLERVRLHRAVQTSVRQAVREAAVPSDAFRARVAAAMAAERERRAGHVKAARWSPTSWRTMAPLAAAAAVVLLWVAGVGDLPTTERKPQEAGVTSSPTAVEQLIDEFVNHHANPPMPEIVDESLVRRFEPRVGVPVHAPSLQQYGAQWEGGSVVSVRPQNRRAASLRYRVGGHRVTLYIYDASRLPLRASLEPRIVRNVPVFVGTRRGYSIAAAEQRGLGYAVATDLNDVQSAELVAASFH